MFPLQCNSIECVIVGLQFLADTGPPVQGQHHVLAGTRVVCIYVSVHTLSARKY